MPGIGWGWSCAVAGLGGALSLALGFGGQIASAGPAVVFDTGTGEVLHAYMATEPWYPASLTKMMTAYVVFRAIEEGRIGLDTTVTIPPNPAAPQPGARLEPGATFTVEEAMPLMLAASLNVMAEVLAITVSGSEADFVAEMNETAARLGMTDTTYANPHGWHDRRHVSSARDLAALTTAIIRDFPQYQRFFAVASVRFGDKDLKNHNGLLGRFPGADGMKTGYHCEAGYNLVGSASRDGRRLVAIVLGAFSEAEREAVAERFLGAGFAQRAGAPTLSLDTLPEPARSAPVDMRPYVCGKEKPPPEFASFGTMAPLPRAKP